MMTKQDRLDAIYRRAKVTAGAPLGNQNAAGRHSHDGSPLRAAKANDMLEAAGFVYRNAHSTYGGDELFYEHPKGKRVSIQTAHGRGDVGHHPVDIENGKKVKEALEAII